jgi:hypothetical protein
LLKLLWTGRRAGKAQGTRRMEQTINERGGKKDNK